MRQSVIKAITLLTLASFIISSQAAIAARFIDLSTVWCEKYVDMLSDQGVISAEPDGKFRPEQPVTRAMLAYWLVKVLGLDNQPVSDVPSFPDVKPSDWFFKPVEIIRQNNYISGFSDGFRPNQFIQKAEVISILSRTLDTAAPSEPEIEKALSVYDDRGKIQGWAKSAVAQATIAGIVVNQKEHVLNPGAVCTRGDAAAMLYKLNQFVTHKSINETEQEAQTAMERPKPAAPATTTPIAPPAPPQGFNQFGGYAPPGQYLESSAQAQTNPAQTAFVPQSTLPPPMVPQNYAPQTNVAPNSYPNQGQYMPPPGQNPMLQGNVTQLAAGTKFQVRLDVGIDSAASHVGDKIEASINEPIEVNGFDVIPAGSKLIGQVTKAVSAKHFKFGANGTIGFKFLTLQMPDGRKIPLEVSISDKSQVKLVGGTTGGRVGKGLLSTGIGAGSGALLGGAVGAMISSSRGYGMSGFGTGALLGGTAGGAIGAGTAAYRKGTDVRILAGTTLPMQLDQSLSLVVPAPQPQLGGGYTGYPPPTQGYPPPYQQGGYPTPSQGYPPAYQAPPGGYPQ
jgi:hypothetical protein